MPHKQILNRGTALKPRLSGGPDTKRFTSKKPCSKRTTGIQRARHPDPDVCPITKAQERKDKQGVKTTRRIVNESKSGRYHRDRKLHVTVVDKHHHVLKPIWDARKRGDLPNKGVKMLHFDSHPDMAVFGSNVPPENTKDVARAKALVPKIHADSFDQLEVLRLSDISDWVFTPVLQGWVDEVIWVAGWWCHQLDNSASHDMFVGISKKDGKIKVGNKGDHLHSAYMEYWSCGGDAAKESELTHVRHFKLHIVHFDRKTCALPRQWRDRIVKICKHHPWILDIDEDYLSTQNPFSVEFEAMFGQSMWQDFGDLMQNVDDEATEATINFAKEDAFLKTKTEFDADPLVKDAVRTLHETCEHVSKPRAKAIVEKIRPILKKLYPKQGPPPRMLDEKAGDYSDEEGEDYLSVRAHYDVDEMLHAAAMSCLPHHISTMQELSGLSRDTRDLFFKISTPPGVITVATSRADMYSPECQSDILNFMVLNFCTAVWDARRDVVTHRRDFRETPLSCVEVGDHKKFSMLARMLTNGKLESLPKVPSK